MQSYIIHGCRIGAKSLEAAKLSHRRIMESKKLYPLPRTVAHDATLARTQYHAK